MADRDATEDDKEEKTKIFVDDFKCECQVCGEPIKVEMDSDGRKYAMYLFILILYNSFPLNLILLFYFILCCFAAIAWNISSCILIHTLIATL